MPNQLYLRSPSLDRATTMPMDAIPDPECFLESSMISVIVRLHLQNIFQGRTSFRLAGRGHKVPPGLPLPSKRVRNIETHHRCFQG